MSDGLLRYFSFEGPISRRDFAFTHFRGMLLVGIMVFIFVLFVILAALLSYLFKSLPGMGPLIIVFSVISSVVTGLAALFSYPAYLVYASLHRLDDIGLPRWYAWLYAIPVVGTLFHGYLLLEEGTSKESSNVLPTLLAIVIVVGSFVLPCVLRAVVPSKALSNITNQRLR